MSYIRNLGAGSSRMSLGLSLSVLLALLLLGAGGAHAAKFESDSYSFNVADVPAWVSKVKRPAPDFKKIRKGVATHYLLSDSQSRVDESSQTEFTRIAYIPMTESGLEDGSSISIDFHPQYETLNLHYVAVVRNGKRSEKLMPEKVRLIQQERDIDKLLYNGTVTALFVMDDIRVGDTVEYAYSVSGTNPVFGDKYFSSYSLGWQVGVDLVSVRVLAPKNRKLRTRVYNTSVKPKVRSVGNMKEHVWKVANARPLVDEGDYPGWYNPYPWVQISEYRNWNEVNEWAASLFTYQGEFSAGLSKKVRAWGKKKQDERVRRAIQFVQDEIRYFGVEMGQNSHRPSHPNEVFERRYGDCKDKALLLTAIFREWGIEAWPALVSVDNQKAIADWLPAPGLFDHVIVKANIDGEVHWIDATSTYQRGDLAARSVPDYGKTLLVGAKSGGLASMGKPRDYQPTIVVEEYFKARDYKKPVEFTVKSVFTHDEAEWKRSYFSNRTLDEIANRYVNFYASIYPGIELRSDIEFSDDEKSNVVTIVEKYRIHDFWERENGKMYHTFYGSTIKDYTGLPRIINRKMPLAMSFPLRVRHTSILEYPEDIDFEGIDDTITISDNAIDFTMTSSYADRRLKVEYAFTSMADAVFPEKMAPHMAKRRKVNDNLYFSAWITDEEYMAKNNDDRRDRMKSLISGLLSENSE